MHTVGVEFDSFSKRVDGELLALDASPRTSHGPQYIHVPVMYIQPRLQRFPVLLRRNRRHAIKVHIGLLSRDLITIYETRRWSHEYV